MRYKFYLVLAFVGLSTLANAQWTSLNGPYGGSVNDLERDNNGNTYALVNQNSLFKSTDNGASWSKLITSPASLTLNDVLFANNKFYAVYFSNFYTSADGLTWTRVTTVPFVSGDRLLKFGPDGYIAVYGGDGLFVTKDDGVNWTKVSDDIIYAFGYERAVATTNGDLYLISRDPNNIYSFKIKKLPYPGANGTFDPANWQIKYISDKAGTITADLSSNIVTGTGTQFTTQLTVGSSIYTTNGKRIGTVSSITNNTSLVLYSNSQTAVTGSVFNEYTYSAQLVTNGSKVYLFSDRNILVTEDGGTTWPSINGNITDSFFAGYGEVNSSGTLYYYNENVNKIYSLTNPGIANSTWNITDVSSIIGSFNTGITCWAFVNSTTALAGSYSSGVFKTADSGSSFSLSSSGLTGAAGRSIAMTNSGNKIINTISSSRGYWLSNDLGSTWSFATTSGYYSKVLKLSDGTLLLYGSNSIARSTDNLATPFTEIAQLSTELVEASDGALFAVSSNMIYTSIDKGATWAGLGTPLSGWPALYGGRFITTDNTYLYISVSSGSTSNLLKVAKTGGAVTVLTSFPSTSSLVNLFTVGNDIYAAQSSNIYKSSDQGVSWTSIGFSGSAVFPLSDGATTALCVSRGGGFYLTQDGGNSWNSFSLPSSSAYITGITKDPASPSSNPIYYASAANSPALKFTGKVIVDPATLPPYINFNWQPLNGPYGGYASDIEQHPDGSLYSVAGGNMYKYSNNSWSRLNPISASLTSVNDLEIDNSGNIYALVSSGSISTPRIYVSTNGGSTWTSKPGLFKISSTYYPGYRLEKMPDNSIVVMSDRNIFRSTDDATTFTSVANYPNGYFSISFPFIVKPNLLVAPSVVSIGFVYSTDNGATWNNKGSNGLPLIIGGTDYWVNDSDVDQDGNFLITVADSYDQAKNLGDWQIYKSTDLGLNWVKITTPNGNLVAKSIEVMPNGDYLLSYNDNYVLYKSTDKGTTWTSLSSIGDVFGGSRQVGSDLYLKGNNGIYKTSDNGATLIPINTGMPRSSGQEIKLLDNKDLIVASARPFHSSDLGQTWSQTQKGYILRFLVKGDSVIGYGGSLIYLSTDNGKTWTPKGTDRYFDFITTYDGKSFYAVSSSSLVARGLFFSTDLISWTQINVTGLPADPLSYTYQSLAVDQNSILYAIITQGGVRSLYKIAYEVATKISGIINPTAPVKVIFYKNKVYVYDNVGTIYVTQDGGNSWQSISAPGGTTFTISNDYFFIMGANTVLWVSRNNGASWQSVGESFIAGSNFQDVIVNEYDGYAYAIQTNNVVKKSQVIVTVDDKTNPLASTFSPSNNSTGVGLKPTLSITFDEVTKAVPGKLIRVFDLANLAVPIETMDMATATQNGKTWSIPTTATLSFNKTYFVIIGAGAVADIFGNQFAGISSNTTWRFTTKNTPTISTLSPASGETTVVTNSSFKISFLEPVTGLAGKNVTLYAASAPNTPVATLGANTGVSSGNDLTYTFTAGTLQYGTQYFIKVDAGAFTTADGGVFSALTLNTDWTFTTRSAPTVATLLPSNSATNVDVSAANTKLAITLSENFTFASGKKIYVTDTKAASTPVFSIDLTGATFSGATATITLPNNLSYSLVYAITFDPNSFVAASDGGAFSLFTSSGWQFTTADAPDTQAPAITPSALTIDKNVSGSTFNATITDNVGVAHAKLFYRSITSNNAFASTDLTASTNNQYSVNLQSSVYSSMPIGIEYYLTASDAAANEVRSPQTGNFYTYFSFSGTNTPTIPTSLVGIGGGVSDWRIVTVPYKLSDSKIFSVLNVLGSDDVSKWRLITYKNQTSWSEYPTDFSSFTQGIGYFINVRSLSTGIAISNATTPNNNKATPYTFALKPGWNMIGNPYTFPMDWSEVKSANSSVTDIAKIAGSLKSFRDGNYIDKADGVLQVFEGAFVLNSGTATVNVTVPVTGKYAGGRTESMGNSMPQSSNRKLSDDQWVAPISIKIGDIENTFGGIGMNPMASKSVDEFDDFNPPRWLNYAEINFDHPEHFLKASTRDIVTTVSEYDWTFSIDTNLAGTANLTWDNSDFGKNSKQLFLLDINQEILIDMRAQNSYSFDAKKSSSFKIYYGENLLSKIKPQTISLGDAYPNPTSNGKVTIPFTLPDSQSTYQVEMEVFNSMGQKVSTVISESLNPGFYSSQWEPSEYLLGGVYIYRLKVVGKGNSSVISKKLIVNR